MGIRLDTIRARKKITKPAIKAAKDLLQVVDYIEDGRIENATYNLDQVMTRLKVIFREMKKL